MAILAPISAVAQHKMAVTIWLPKTVKAEDISIAYNNGYKHHVSLGPNARKVFIEDTLYSKYGTISIGTRGIDTSDFFWVTNEPAVIQMPGSFGNRVFQLVNAQNVKGNTWCGLKEACADAWDRRVDFLKKHPGYSGDSLYKLFNELTVAHRSCEMSYLSTHSSEYFSFWYFISFFYSEALRPETVISFFENTFPKEFKESSEGKIFLEYQLARNKRKLYSKSPDFECTTVDGSVYSLSSFKGKYLLIDFWASWCGPCIKNIPTIKHLRDSYSREKFAVLAVSEDFDFVKFERAIKTYHMSEGLNVYGNYRLPNQFGRAAMPTYVLIDRDGYIIYNSQEMKDYDLTLLNKTVDSVMQR
ncbi:hypothetical protein DCC81_20510 [Chitinophaga parva]|uniref:Thioredoxin domain-containing protein n=1 Tax=Chitinophaga parva TaxID=2169414 RepID=A0A2T7BCR9_9BACT|nr:hypothetical protein DCC81_20510 [Chitinophaga parva]